MSSLYSACSTCLKSIWAWLKGTCAVVSNPMYSLPITTFSLGISIAFAIARGLDDSLNRVYLIGNSIFVATLISSLCISKRIEKADFKEKERVARVKAFETFKRGFAVGLAVTRVRKEMRQKEQLEAGSQVEDTNKVEATW